MSKITYEVVEHGGGRYLPGPSDTPFAYKKRTQPTWGLRERVADTCTRFKVDRLLIEAKASGISAAQELRNRYATIPGRYRRVLCAGTRLRVRTRCSRCFLRD
jgi:hypothetical protein